MTRRARSISHKKSTILVAIPENKRLFASAKPKKWQKNGLREELLLNQGTFVDKPLVALIMGSKSDWDTMKHAAAVLDEFGVPHEAKIVSAHRTPDLMFEYAESAAGRGIQVIIAGAGGAAALPGMTASKTVLPVFGVPVESKTLRGIDSLLSIVQMPKGIPVGTLAIGSSGAANAALLAIAVVALKDPDLQQRLQSYRSRQTDAVLKDTL